MKRTIHILVIFAAAMWALSGCTGNGDKGAAQAGSGHVHADHDHEGHDHAGHDHDHEGHDHAAERHDHEGHAPAAEEPAHADEGQDHEAHDHAGHDHAAGAGEAHSDEIIFPVAQAERTDFKVETVERGPFSEVIRCSGEVLAAQDDESTVAATVGGIVDFAGAKRLSQGMAVSAGETLFYVDSRSLSSGDAVGKARAAYNKALADYERAKMLLADKIVSQKEFDAIEAEMLRAKAEWEPLSESSGQRGGAVKAPATGYVTLLNVKPGDYVEMGQPLAVISKNRRLRLVAEVSQRYYRQVKSVRSANFRSAADDRIHSLESLNGRLLSVGKVTGAGSTLIPVTFEFDNDGETVAGSYVEVFLVGPRREGVIAVPVSAITEAQGLYYVYVQLDAEGYQRREVKLGASDGERVEILSGLQPGDRLVTRGAINVKMAAASGAIPHSHSHNH